MDENFAKVLAFVVFIALGWGLRRLNILKPEAFHAISALVMCVTLPCVTMTGLNGFKLSADYAVIAAIGFLANVLFLIIAIFLTLGTKNIEERDFRRLNLTGFSVGPFAIPYVQAFLSPASLLTALVFDLGNAFMAAGGTYAAISGMREKTSPAKMIGVVFKKLATSGPIIAFVFMLILCLLSLKLPDAVITCTRIGAAANTFLCMVMIGEALNLSLTFREFLNLLKILAMRFVLQALLAFALFEFLPFDLEVRRALVLVCFAPVPAMNLIYTNLMKGNLSKAANLNTLSVFVAILSMSAVIYIL